LIISSGTSFSNDVFAARFRAVSVVCRVKDTARSVASDPRLLDDYIRQR
jgi:hypothetical protein